MDCIKTSCSDNEYDLETDDICNESCPINSNETALMAISNLKQFLNNDNEAFKHLKILETHLQKRLFEGEIKNSLLCQ